MLLLCSISGYAQNSNRDFSIVDKYVQSVGSLDSVNMGTISNIVTKKFPDNLDKVRAIFDWIAYNISFDCKLYRSSGNEKMVTDDVLKKRKANANGYAALFQDMCSVAKIRCLTVDGYVKRNTESINEKPDELNHTWVVVQLGETTDPWNYIDPAWGSGYTDEQMTVFTRQYNDDYFFADKLIFNYQHFPDNGAWLFGPAIKNQKDFFSLPLVLDDAYVFGLTNFLPADGYVKSKSRTPVRFSIKIKSGPPVEIVSVVTGKGKKKLAKTVDHTLQNGVISFSYKFTEEDIYPVFVLINNKPVLGYVMETTE